ncbi:hypothetical protein [Desulfovibrio oxyclinae]|uniref:hypothetical protein n=1 Tax=Desulfovibrio oxyclinae TaxID=63560 RepID=UPI000370AD71|nr:hypothetical protein [Desulfovibrio oxyclinae]
MTNAFDQARSRYGVKAVQPEQQAAADVVTDDWSHSYELRMAWGWDADQMEAARLRDSLGLGLIYAWEERVASFEELRGLLHRWKAVVKVVRYAGGGVGIESEPKWASGEGEETLARISELFWGPAFDHAIYYLSKFPIREAL